MWHTQGSGKTFTMINLGDYEQLEDELRREGIHVEQHVEQGPVVETIINIAIREQVDLIAMASHGRSGLSRVFYGSIAAGLLQRVDRPLLLIRSRDND